MKCSLGISCFLEEISGLSHCVVFFYFFVLIAEEGFLISPWYSLELCIQMGISFLLCFAKCSNFIHLHVAVQFSQHHLLKRVFLPHCMFLPSFKNKVPIGTWAYCWAFYLVPLVYISVFLPVLYCLYKCSFEV